MNAKNQAIFETHAHALCRKWKKVHGFSNSQVVELIKKTSGNESNPSLVSCYMGNATGQARFLPVDIAYAFYLHPDFMYQNLQEELDELAEDPVAFIEKRPEFPFHEYVYSKSAAGVAIRELGPLSSPLSEEQIEQLHKREKELIISYKKSAHCLIEIVEKVEGPHVLGLKPLRFTGLRKQFLYHLFKLWQQEGIDESEREWSPFSYAEPEMTRKLLIKILEETK